jgi:hypothetical protein
MLLAQGLPWIRFEAEQWHTVQPPGFVWDATLYAGSARGHSLRPWQDRHRDAVLRRRGEGHRLRRRLPTRGKAVWKLEHGDEEYIDVTLTELDHEASGAGVH